MTANPGGALPFTLTPSLTKTTLLYSSTPLTYGTGAGLGVGSGAPAQNTPDKYYFTGRSDNFGPGGSSVTTNARFDPEVGSRLQRRKVRLHLRRIRPLCAASSIARPGN